MRNNSSPTLADPQRRSLLFGLTGGLALGTPLALLGCGGGGSADGAGAAADPMADAPAMARLALPVQVALPAGTGMDPRRLALATGSSIARVAADGSSGIVMLDQGAALAYLVADDGRLMGMGFIGSDRRTVDARSTAEALVYLGSNPAQLGETWQYALRHALAGHALVDPVAAAVQAAMLAGGIGAHDDALMTALHTAVATIRRPNGARAQRVRARPLRLSYADSEHSGIHVVAQPGFNTIALENRFRRRAVATVEYFGYVTAAGEIVNLPPVQIGRFDVNPTDALNVANAVNAAFEKTVEDLLVNIGLIGDYELGDIPWTPKTSDAFELPMRPEDAAEALYRVNVIGLGAQAASREFNADELKIYDDLLWSTAIKDLIVPTISTLVLPIVGEMAAAPLKDKGNALFALAAGLDLNKGALAQELFPQTVDALRRGQWFEASLAVTTELVGTDTGKKLMTESLANIARWAGGAAVATIRDPSGALLGVDLASTEGQKLARNFVSGLEKVTGVIDAIEKGMLVLDVGAQAKDIVSSRMLDDFRIDGMPAEVVLEPADVTLRIDGDSQRFQVSTVDGQAPAADLLFEWSCPSAHGILTVGEQATSQANPRLLPAPSPSALYVVGGGNQGGETETIALRVLDSRGHAIGRATARVTIERGVKATLSPAEAVFERGAAAAQQVFEVVLDPPPLDPTTIQYDWICPSQHGTLQSGGVTTSLDQPRVTSGQPQATYRLAPGSLGGEREAVTVEVYERSVDPGTGEVARRKLTTAQATARVKGEFNLRISPPGPTDVPTDTTFPITAFIAERLPVGATTSWEWSYAGVGSLGAEVPDTNPADSRVDYATGAADGATTVTVRATVTLPADGGQPVRIVVTEPVRAVFNVKKGQRTITFEASGGAFACSDPKACGVSTYGAYLVPRMAKAVSYRAVFSGFGYGPCNRSVTWTTPVPDGGGCNFPISYHPHSSQGATNTWAVWLGFGGPDFVWAPDGKCTVTITLAA